MADEEIEGEPEGEREGSSREAWGDADSEADALTVTLLQGEAEALPEALEQGLALWLAVGERPVLAVALLKRELVALSGALGLPMELQDAEAVEDIEGEPEGELEGTSSLSPLWEALTDAEAGGEPDKDAVGSTDGEPDAEGQKVLE